MVAGRLSELQAGPDFCRQIQTTAGKFGSVEEVYWKCFDRSLYILGDMKMKGPILQSCIPQNHLQPVLMNQISMQADY